MLVYGYYSDRINNSFFSKLSRLFYATNCSLILLSLFIIGCGGAGTGRGDEPYTPGRIYVDSDFGNDISGDGSIDFPFQTVTKALKKAEEPLNSLSDWNIYIQYGTYSSDTGEEFPIIVPSGTELIGESPIDLENHLFVKIIGSGAYTSSSFYGENQVAIVLTSDNSIANIVVECIDGMGILSENKNSGHIFNCVFRNSEIGITTINESITQINQNSIYNNSTGIQVHNKSKPVIIRNKINNNNIGITVLDTAKPVFLKEARSVGVNEILNNDDCDFQNLGEADLNIVGTIWDDDPFNFNIENNCADGANIVNEGIGGVNYQYIPPQNAPIFPGTRRILLQNPGYGELLSTTTPNFTWSSTGALEIVVMVWDHPPKISSNQTLNENEFIWCWHTGIGTGLPGSISYQDGRKSIDGSLDSLEKYDELERGSSYYWAVWEWDKYGRQIMASSDLGYFRIEN